MTTTSKPKRKYRAFIPSIDNTTRHDTITMQQWHKFRDAEYERFQEEKRKEEEGDDNEES